VQAYQAGLREVSIVTSTNILGRMSTQQYAVAHPERYILAPVYYAYYASLEDARRDVARRCAARMGHTPTTAR